MLHGQVFQNPLLDLLQAVVIGVEDFLGQPDVLFDPGPFLPRDRQHPVQVVADHGGFGRHRRHGFQLFQLAQGLFPCFLGKLGFLDFLLDFGGFVAAVLGFAQFLLDRLELFVQIVLALGLLHLSLDPVADLLLNLQNADFGFHVGVNLLQPVCHQFGFQKLLLFGNFQC